MKGPNPRLSVGLVVEGLADEGGTEAQAVAIAEELAGRGHRVAVASRWPLQTTGERFGRLRQTGAIDILAPKTTGALDRIRPSEYNLRRALRLSQSVIARRRPLSQAEWAADDEILAARNHDVNVILRRKLGAWIAADGTDAVVTHVIGRNAASTVPAIRGLGAALVYTQLGQFGFPSSGIVADRLPVDLCTADSTVGACALALLQGGPVVKIPSIGGFEEEVSRLPSRVDRLVMVNRLDPVKHVDVAITAVADLPGISLDIFGGGQEYERLQNLIQSLGAAGRVALRGPATSTVVREALDRAHAFILCSKSEGTPTAILEAMSRARPVITTAVGGTTDLIREGEEGLFFDGTATDLVDKVRRLTSVPGLGIQLGTSARARWVSEFAPEAIVDRYELVYRRAARVRACREGEGR